jgi:GntR family transcriptional regulator of bglA
MAPLSVTSDVLDFSEIFADEEIADKMEVPIGSPLYYVVRMRYVDNKPYMYEYNYFNKALMPGFDKDTAEGSIFTYLNDEVSLPVSFMDFVIRAVKIKLNEAEKFQLNEGDPGLLIDGFTMIRTGEVVQYYKLVCHYENVRLLKLASYF